MVWNVGKAAFFFSFKLKKRKANESEEGPWHGMAWNGEMNESVCWTWSSWTIWKKKTRRGYQFLPFDFGVAQDVYSDQIAYA